MHLDNQQASRVIPTPTSEVSASPTATASPSPSATPITVKETEYQTSAGLRFADATSYIAQAQQAQSLAAVEGVLSSLLKEYGVTQWSVSGQELSTVSKSISWQYLGTSDITDFSSLRDYSSLFIDEWTKNPKSWILNTQVRHIAFIKDLQVSGTNDHDAVTDLTTGTIFLQVKPETYPGFFRRTIQHEIGHLTGLNAYNGLLPEEDLAWKEFNPTGFSYHSISGDSYTLQAEHPENGFVTRYAQTGIQEDKSELYSYLFDSASYPKLKEWIKSDNALAGKVQLYKNSIKAKVPFMDDQFFDQINGL